MVLIDCHHAGVSGDMLLAALLDLGADVEAVGREIERCTEGQGSVVMKVSRVKRASIACTKVDFEISGSKDEIDMDSCVKRAGDLWVRERAMKVLETLKGAESAVHGTGNSDHHHLHEVGRIDAIADIVGSLTAWRNLGFDKMEALSTRVALGGGSVVFSHGNFPVPTPATAEILKGVPVVLGGDRELTTPTGASLLVNLAGSFVDQIDLVAEKTGWGAGLDAGEFLNATRIIVGVRDSGEGDFVDVLETSTDDATPEALGHAAEELMEEGALDVSIIPSMMKKGRPGHLIRVISRPGDTERLCDALLSETGSLGARIHRGLERRKWLRKVETVRIQLGGKDLEARVKMAYGRDGALLNAKPEYSDVVRICRETGLGFPEVQRAIMGSIGENSPGE